MSDEHPKESRREVRICKPEVHTQPELALVELLVNRLFGPSCLVPNVLRVKHGELPCARVRAQVYRRASGRAGASAAQRRYMRAKAKCKLWRARTKSVSKRATVSTNTLDTSLIQSAESPRL